MRFPSLLGTLCLFVCALLRPPCAPARPPNILFILTDDLGYGDLGCKGGGRQPTPTLDRFAAAGIRFTNGYACGSTSQPSRAALLTGQYGARTGVYTSGQADRFDWESRPLRPVENVPFLPLDRRTIAQALKEAGYATAFIGKWHLGEETAYLPQRRGFDDALTVSGSYFTFKTEPPAEIAPGTYLTDYLTDRAIDYLRRPRDRPFFLMLSHLAVHAPYEAKPELVSRLKSGAQKETDELDYAAMIASLDENMARLLAALDEAGLAKDTLVIFTSDNGGSGGYTREGILKVDEVTNNLPLRGGEGMFYEGGLRVPFLFRWPEHIAPGSICETPISGVDLFPTMLGVAETAPAREYPLDGESYLPLLLNGGAGTLHRDAIFWHFPGYLGAGGNTWRSTPVSVIRQGEWKLLEFFENQRLELYNLREDAGETHNLAAELPERARALRERLSLWRKQIGARMPTRNPDRQAPAEPRFSKQELLQ